MWCKRDFGVEYEQRDVIKACGSVVIFVDDDLAKEKDSIIRKSGVGMHCCKQVVPH